MEPMKNHSVSETSLSEISLIDFYYLILLKLFLNHYLKSGSNGLDFGIKRFRIGIGQQLWEIDVT